MNTDNIRREFNESMEELIQLVSSLDQEQINIVPFEGSWTAGQLAKHLVISGSGFVQTLNGPVKETERPPDEMVEKIKTIFLDFNTKMKSPDFVVPPQTLYDKEELLQSLKDIHTGVNLALETMDLAKTCTGFQLPVLGFLTRLEAICFVLYHTKRHINQLKKIQHLVMPALNENLGI